MPHFLQGVWFLGKEREGGRRGTLMGVSSPWPHGIKCAVREHREWIPPKNHHPGGVQGTQGSTESGLRVSSQVERMPHQLQVGTDVSKMLPGMDPHFPP